MPPFKFKKFFVKIPKASDTISNNNCANCSSHTANLTVMPQLGNHSHSSPLLPLTASFASYHPLMDYYSKQPHVQQQQQNASASNNTDKAATTTSVAAAVALNIAKLFTANISQYQREKNNSNVTTQLKTAQTKDEELDAKSVVSLSSSSSSIKLIQPSDHEEEEKGQFLLKRTIPIKSRVVVKNEQDELEEEEEVEESSNNVFVLNEESNSSGSSSVHLIVDETSMIMEPAQLVEAEEVVSTSMLDVASSKVKEDDSSKY